VGLLLALASVGIAWWILHGVNPKTLSLAYRIDRERTVLFLRTKDRSSLSSINAIYAPSIAPASLPSTMDLPEARSLELALIKRLSGSGTAWVIYAHTEKGRHVTFLSEEDPSLSLPLKEMDRSLARDNLFEETVTDDSQHVLWANLRSLPLSKSPTSSLLRSLLAPYESALVIWEQQEAGKLLLKKGVNERSRMIAGGTIPSLLYSEEPLFELRSQSFFALMKRTADAMQKENPTLREGLSGIARAMEEQYTHSTDVSHFLSELFQPPATFAVFHGSGSLLSFVMAGTATTSDTLSKWKDAVASTVTPGMIRTQRFFRENSRTDVIAETENLIAEEPLAHGWEITRMGASGSNANIFLARRDTSFLVSNDHPLLLRLLPSTRNAQKSTEGGTLSLPWTLVTVQKMFPFLGKDTRTLAQMLFPAKTERIRWEGRETGNAYRIQWSLLKTK